MPDRPERCPSCGTYSLHLSYRNGVAICDQCDDSPITSRTIVRNARELTDPDRAERRTRRFS